MEYLGGGQRQFPPALIYNVRYIVLRVGGEIYNGRENLEVLIRVSIIASDPRTQQEYLIEATIGADFQLLAYRFDPIQYMG